MSFSLKTIDENAHINVHRETIFTSDEIKKNINFCFLIFYEGSTPQKTRFSVYAFQQSIRKMLV